MPLSFLRFSFAVYSFLFLAIDFDSPRSIRFREIVKSGNDFLLRVPRDFFWSTVFRQQFNKYVYELARPPFSSERA